MEGSAGLCSGKSWEAGPLAMLFPWTKDATPYTELLHVFDLSKLQPFLLVGAVQPRGN